MEQTGTTATSTEVMRALPDSLPREKLAVQIDFYEDSVVMRDYSGPVVKTKMVSPVELATALSSSVTFHSGLLPRDVLWWARGANGPIYAVWEKAKKRKVAVMGAGGIVRYEIPLPGFVFLVQPGQVPAIFAAKKRPTSGRDKLYHAPTYNVFTGGRICVGTHKFPQNPSEVPEHFFISYFSPHGDFRGRSRMFPNGLEDLWMFLDNEHLRTYPLDDLVEWGTVQELMDKGMPW